MVTCALLQEVLTFGELLGQGGGEQEQIAGLSDPASIERVS